MLKKIQVVAGVAVLLSAAAVGMVFSTGAGSHDDDETEIPITGDALERASAAALAYVGAGRVTGTEEGDEESFYEVEVTLDDGKQIDVQLDEKFQVVTGESDDGEEDGSDD
jgi:hypothetical protein